MQTMLQTIPPTATGFYMPAEWAQHAGCWMAWPRRDAAHRGFLREARQAYAAVAHAIATFEPVSMVVHPEDEATAKKLLSADIAIIPMPIDDAWLRDSGPTFVVHPNGEIAGIDWLFNAWGEKYRPWHDDDAFAGNLLRHLNLPRFLAPLVMEGGSIHTNSAGTLLTTSQCLLHPNRNPRLTKGDIEQLLCAYLGVSRIVWLVGDLRDDETDGHIDNVACFTTPDRVLLMADEQDATLRENQRIINAALDANDNAFTVTALPHPSVVENGVNLLASYINFYIANGGIVMPSFGLPEDDEARAVIADEFPDRQVIQVPASDIVRGGGGIHCITQQQPA